MPKKYDTAQITRIDRGEMTIDTAAMSEEELIRYTRHLEAQLHAKNLELANLQITETRIALMSQSRALMVEKYVREIAALDRSTPGGLKSIEPSENDDPDLVAEAWRVFVSMQRGGGGRF